MYKTSISIILASALGFGGGSAMGFSIPHSSSGSPSESTVKSDVDYKPSNDDHSDSGPRDMYDSNKGEETKNPGIKHYPRFSS